MIKEIKELRIKIDGFAKLTNSLESFKVVNSIHPELKDQEENLGESGRLMQIGFNRSRPFDELLYKHMLLIDTDRGFFRFDTNNIKSFDTLNFDLKSKEINKAVDSLYLAKAWGGNMLAELGNQTPYDSGYKTEKDIKPTADTSDLNGGATSHNFNMLNSHIEKVDWLRQEIQIVIKEVENLGRTQERTFTKEWNIARTNSYTHLSEARFWLGFELQRIKETGTKEQ